MKMTDLEKAAKRQIQDILNKQGYPTYSRLLDKLDVKLIDTQKQPGVIAYLVVDKAVIYLNPGLNIDQVSTIVRHEILHEYLTHAARAQKFREKDPKYKNIPHDLVNIAADYEISNRGYTDADKAIARSILLDNKVLQGLVTEDQHPGWEDKSFEEMLELLTDEMKDNIQNLQNLMSDLGIQPPPDEEDAQDIQDAADQLGKAAGEGDGDEESEEQKDQADKISKAAKNLKDQISKNEQSKASNKGPFETDKQQEIDEETKAKADALKKALSQLKDDIFEETEDAISKEKAAKRAKDAARYKDSPLSRFSDSLNQFMKRELATGRGPSWSRMNKKYAGSGIIRPGTSRLSQNKVPLINVYFDRSGSWDSSKTVKGQQTIATLNKYVNRGELKINLYYFSNNVHSEEKEALREGGTQGQPILDHILATKPDNVIILTDADIDDCETDVTVPGGVWMLFYGGRSQNLMDHLHGLKLTKYFDIGR